jgi:hypothetical protein
MRALRRPLLIVLAIVFLIEAWLWEHLSPLVRWVVDRLSWPWLRVWLAALIERLPPYAMLVVFVIPGVCLFPLKLLGLWLMSGGHWFFALLVLAFAKLVGLGVSAFIFDVTKPKLLQLSWFRWIYEHVLAWLAWAHELVDPIKERLRRYARLFAPQRAGRTFKLLRRIRQQRIRAQAA